jgi:hypothetical protein
MVLCDLLIQNYSLFFSKFYKVDGLPANAVIRPVTHLINHFIDDEKLITTKPGRWSIYRQIALLKLLHNRTFSKKIQNEAVTLCVFKPAKVDLSTPL